MKLFRKLTNVIDWFVPPGYLELNQYDVILRSRVTATFMLLSSIMSFYVGFMMARLTSLQHIDVHTGQIALYMFGAGYFLIALFFRQTGSFFVVANVYAVSCYVAMYFGSFVFGGTTENPLSLFLLIVPMVTFIITGKYTGLFWTAVNILFFVITATLHLNEHYSLLSPEMMRIFQIATWATLSVSFFIILFIYDQINAQLRYVISAERNHFEFEAGHDKLTGLLNRASYQTRLGLCMDRIKLTKCSAIVGLIDLDGFKPINDKYGHHAGDVVLKVVSQRMLANMRKTDTLARLGGDEFAFILQDVRSEEMVDKIVTTMLQAIGEPIEVDGLTVQVSGSIGLARCPEDKSTSYDILRAADVAMYDAKKEKGRYCYFSDVENLAEAEAATQG